jgi:glycerol kinase
MVPAFVGLGAPYWDSEAKGAIVGITRGTTREDVVRAALDSIAYQVRDVIVAMESDTGHRISELRGDGGAVANPYLMQFQADILDRPVVLPKIVETTAMGAAMLAGLAAGVWKSSASLDQLRHGGRIYRPKMRGDLRDQILAGWREAVSRVLTT